MSAEEEFTFDFRIEKFDMAGHRTGEKIQSPHFEAFDGAKWNLQVFPRGNREEYEEFVSCFLERAEKDAGPDEVTVSYSFQLIANDASPQETHSVERRPIQRSGTWGFGQFVKRDSLFKVRSLLLPNDTLTIRCRLVRKWPGDLFKQDLFVRTRIGSEKMQFAWQIRNLSKDMKQRFNVVHRRPEFSLTLWLETNKTVRIEIRLTNGTAALPVVAFCRIAVVDADGRTSELAKEEFHVFEKPDAVWLFPSFLTMKVLKEKGCVVDDELWLNCSMEKSTGTTETRLERTVYGDQTRNLLVRDEVLYKDMKQLLDGDRYQDVKLLVENESVLAHQIVLHSRSPVFRQMITDKGSEVNGDLLELEVRDVDLPTLKRMLEYIYSEDMDSKLDFDSLLKLYAAADAYQVAALKDSCSTELRKWIDVENACEVLSAGRRHGDLELEERAVDFLAEYWDEMSLSEEWEEFASNYEELSADTRRRIRGKKLKD